MKFNWSKIKPYLLVILIFFAALYIFLLVFDNLIMPGMVHDRKTVKVPDVAGKSLDEAAKTLVAMGLGYQVSSEQYNESLSKETVMKQVPTPGTEVKVDRIVYLTISKGKQLVTVPSLVGKTIRDARVDLMKFGLELGDINYDYSDIIAADSIISQSPKPNEMVPYGKSISLVVSKGSNNKLVVPALIGMRVEDVESVLQDKGFTLGTISYEQSETFTSGTVIKQSPMPNEESPLGSPVNIIVSK